MVPVKTREAQLQAKHSSKQSDFESISMERGECGRIPRSLLEQRFRALSGFEARPSHAFERPMAAEHAPEVMSSTMCEKTAPMRCFQVLSKKKGPAQAMISNAK